MSDQGRLPSMCIKGRDLIHSPIGRAILTRSFLLFQALREWQAFNDCKRTIDDFLEQLPLFKMLAHKAMRPRHWQEIMRSTGNIFI